MRRAGLAVALFALTGCAQADAPDVVTAQSSLRETEGHVYAVALALDLPRTLDLKERKARVAAARAELLSAFPQDDLEVVHAFALVPGLAVRPRSREVVSALAAHPLVRAVGPDEGGAGVLDQSVPFVGATTVHAAGRRGQGRRVAVVDTGVDTDHPDLVASLVDGACFCTASATCCGSSGTTGLGLASAEDDHGHGTHVSGIITSDGVVAPLGVAPDAEVVVARVMQNNQFASTSDIVAALEWVRLDHPSVDAVNMSLGTSTRYPARCDEPSPGYSPPAFLLNFSIALDLLRAAEIVPVVAAGNDGDRAFVSAPACLSGAFAVGASANAANTVTGFTNSNPAVDVWAPGATILSSFLVGGAASLNGTSMSTPHVSATAALANQANPFHPVGTVEDCLRTSPVSITDPANGLTRPRLDVAAAVAACETFGLGAPCTVAGECASGFCADGVCCNEACGGSAVDCQACSVASGASVDGQCALAAAGAPCRPSAGTCDVAESCDGVSAVCPADAVVASGTECRASVGACDLPEACDGVAAACPRDGKFGGICRAAVGACDQAERCDGVRDDCPPDDLYASSRVCRGAVGPCDLAETCTGASPDCPPDQLRVGVCRASAGGCDPAEVCDGQSTACPTDGRSPAGTECRAAAGPCDVAEQCTGVSPACPADLKRTDVCRAAAGPCDLEEVCDGVSDACPSDARATAEVVCRGAVGPCDAIEYCSGSDAACPQDLLRTGVCRAAAGPCDVADLCDGVSAGCGVDRVATSTVVCRAPVGPCDLEERCDGASLECPADAFARDGSGCPDGVACNGNEYCEAGVCLPGGAPTCDDGDPCTVGACAEPEGCVQTPVPGCCSQDADCDDGDVCTIDRCSGPGGTCSYTGRTACCRADAECDDGRVCTEDVCVQGACEARPIEGCCVTSADCPAALCETVACIEGVCEAAIDEGCTDEGGCGCTNAAGTRGSPACALGLIGTWWFARRRRRARCA